MIGQILKAMRNNKKLMQNEISEITNIPQNTISQYETGKIVNVNIKSDKNVKVKS